MPDFPGRTTGTPVQIASLNAEAVLAEFRQEAERELDKTLDRLADNTVEAFRDSPVPPMRRETGAMQDGYRWRRSGGLRFAILNIARSLRGYPYPREHPDVVPGVIRRFRQRIIARTQRDIDAGGNQPSRWRA